VRSCSVGIDSLRMVCLGIDLFGEGDGYSFFLFR
jgi:hypothetical protein